jgi:hypothetical protein
MTCGRRTIASRTRRWRCALRARTGHDHRPCFVCPNGTRAQRLFFCPERARSQSPGSRSAPRVRVLRRAFLYPNRVRSPTSFPNASAPRNRDHRSPVGHFTRHEAGDRTPLGYKNALLTTLTRGALRDPGLCDRALSGHKKRAGDRARLGHTKQALRSCPVGQTKLFVSPGS